MEQNPDCVICGKPIREKPVSFLTGLKHHSVRECVEAIRHGLHPNSHKEG